MKKFFLLEIPIFFLYLLASLITGSGCIGNQSKGKNITSFSPKTTVPESSYDHILNLYGENERAFLLSLKNPLPSSKKKAKHVEPEEGLLISLNQEQIDILSDKSKEFSIQARLERGIKDCEVEILPVSNSGGIKNFDQLMGKRKSPDPFLIPFKTEDGKTIIAKHYQVNPQVEQLLKKLSEKTEGNKLVPDDCVEIEKMINIDPRMPLLHFAASGCWQKNGNIEKSVFHINKELEINPSHPESHLAKADILMDSKHYNEAIEEIVESLYYFPGWELPEKYLKATGLTDCTINHNGFEPEIFIEVAPQGNVVASWNERKKWLEGYATCKAAFRYCPEVRMSFGIKAYPYKMSAFEEMVCLTLSGKSYELESQKGGVKDEFGELLIEAIKNDKLFSFVLFEIIGNYDPNYMKFLPEEIHEEVIDFIKAYILTDATGKGKCSL